MKHRAPKRGMKWRDRAVVVHAKSARNRDGVAEKSVERVLA
jgi:hypothetical protein